MIHGIFLAHRRPGTSRRRAQVHLVDIHTRFVLPISGISRYTQSLTLAMHSDRFAYDFVAESWFESFEAFRTGFESKANEASDADLAEFADFIERWPEDQRPAKARLFAEDHEIVKGPGGRYKWISLMRRKEGLTQEEFFRHWRDQRGPVLAEMPGLRRYVQAHAMPNPDIAAAGRMRERDQGYDGVEFLWFDDIQSLEHGLSSNVFQDGAKLDEPNFIDPMKQISFTTVEHVQIGSY